MGKIDGFLKYERINTRDIPPLKRIENYEEFHQPISKAERSKQAARCMDCGIPFCQYGQEIAGMPSGCPLNNFIPEWNDLLYENHYEAALKRLLKTDVFPEFTSRVCPSPCEKACTCSLHGDAVTICENEKAIIEHAFAHGMMQAKTDIKRSDKKIAIIGSGPSGLACAWQLNRRGHAVDIFERNDRAGGLLMYGIPNMKLDKRIVKRRIDLMKEEGITFHCNEDIHTVDQVEVLLKKYDALVLACGAGNPRDIQVTGRDAGGIYMALDFLTSATKALIGSASTNFIDAKDKHVLVIGGGDTGNDCVGTSIRQGCKSITQLEMMSCLPKQRLRENPWPEWPKVAKTDYGQEEAIAVFGDDPRIYETTVKEFIKDENNQVKQAKLVKLSWEMDQKSKRMQMTEVENSETLVDCDLVLIAAGFLGVQERVTNAFQLDQTARMHIKTTDPYTTTRERIFTCGDARRGQSLVVWAMKEGMDTAKVVDTHLLGYTTL